MKKMLFISYLTLICCGFVFSIDITVNVNNQERTHNAAIFIRPIEVILLAVDNCYGISIESESAIRSFYGCRTDSSYYVDNGLFNVNVYLGPQINVSKKKLEGLLAGVFPGVSYMSKENGFSIKYIMKSEITYNYKVNNGMLIGIYVGTNLLKMNEIYGGLKFGLMMSNSHYKD